MAGSVSERASPASDVNMECDNVIELRKRGVVAREGESPDEPKMTRDIGSAGASPEPNDIAEL